MFSSIGISGCILLNQKFDYLPVESYFHQWHKIQNYLYPDKGWVAEIYTDSFDYSDLDKFENLTISLDELKQSGTYIQGDLAGNTLHFVHFSSGYESWWSEIKKYSQEEEKMTNWKQMANSELFPMVMSKFLFSSFGARFQENFKFSGNLTCGQPVPNIKVKTNFKTSKHMSSFSPQDLKFNIFPFLDRKSIFQQNEE